MKFLLIKLIKLYQATEPARVSLYASIGLSPNACLYQQQGQLSCSHYSIKAIQQYGTIKGLWLSGKRLVSCNPRNYQSKKEKL